MSFAGEGVGLLRLVDAGMSVSAAAVQLGLSRERAYRLLRESGRGAGRAKTRISGDLREQVIEEFGASGSVNRAAIGSGLSHGAARRILVAAGLVRAEPGTAGKPDAKARFLELVEQGWSTAGAARDVGVHPRTGRDWRRGIRKVGNTRVYPDGTVVDYAARTRYATVVTEATDAVSSDRVCDRYLSLDDRLAIADGLINQQTATVIAAGIGRHKSTVSRWLGISVPGCRARS